MLKSFPDGKATGDMVNKVRALCLENGFSLRKFMSNQIDVLKVIPNDPGKAGMKDKDLKLGNFDNDKALEVKWNVKDDTQGFIIKVTDKPATRRGFLVTLSSILLKKKQVIQTLCEQNLNWDDPIADEIAQE